MRLKVRIDKIYRRSLFRVAANATLADAIREMKRKNTEELIVTDKEGRGLGFIDSRDIARLIANREADPRVEVSKVMSSPLITITLSDTAEKACKVMKEKGIHHLVVIDDKGVVRGVLSDLDILKIVASEEQRR